MNHCNFTIDFLITKIDNPVYVDKEAKCCFCGAFVAQHKENELSKLKELNKLKELELQSENNKSSLGKRDRYYKSTEVSKSASKVSRDTMGVYGSLNKIITDYDYVDSGLKFEFPTKTFRFKNNFELKNFSFSEHFRSSGSDSDSKYITENINRKTFVSENDMQSLFDETTCSSLKLLDTHKVYFDYIHTRESMNSVEDSADYNELCTLSGKPDLTSLNMSMCIEFKKSDDCVPGLLLQMYERALAINCVAHYINKSFFIGVTPDICYVLVLQRSIPESRSDSSTLKLELFHITHEIVDKIVSAARSGTFEDFLIQDSSWLLGGLVKLGLQPRLCRVHFLAKSCCNVYDIQLPTLSKVAKRSVCTIYPNVPPSFLVKIVTEDDMFKQEIEALDKVKPIFYYGFYDFLEKRLFICDSFRSVLKDNPDVNPEDHSTAWWNNFPVASSGGVIFMKHGLPLNKHDVGNFAVEIRLKLFCDVLNNSLIPLHSIGLCHFDIRAANIVSFEGEYHLIDFGEVISANSIVTIERDETGRSKFWPSKLRRLLEYSRTDVSYTWTTFDDIEMLANACLY